LPRFLLPCLFLPSNSRLLQSIFAKTLRRALDREQPLVQPSLQAW
jgi:hypothetical protein